MATGFSHEAPIEVLDKDHWSVTDADRRALIDALEAGHVLHLPAFAFELTPDEQDILGPDLVSPKRKNISFDAGRNQLNGVADNAIAATVKALLARYHHAVLELIGELFPHYSDYLCDPVNSLRVHDVSDWQTRSSWRKDDRRMHVDAFPSRPVRGNRILRVFTNINPDGMPRRWRVGEPFPELAERFLPRLKPYSPLSSWAQDRLKITKGRRTHYDHLMLALHDSMKADDTYQQHGRQWHLDFHPGSTWICYSDQVSHAAVSGQFMLEQTFLVALKGMRYPQRTPLKVLEQLTGRSLL
ncbi:MAG: Kdo hydroxylase family protein [Porticoccaceae bacterium]